MTERAATAFFIRWNQICKFWADSSHTVVLYRGKINLFNIHHCHLLVFDPRLPIEAIFPLQFLHKNDVRTVLSPVVLGGLISLYLCYLCLFAYSVSNIYCIVFLFCFSSSCVFCVASFSGL